MQLPLKDRALIFLLKKIGNLSLKNIYRLAVCINALCKIIPLGFKKSINLNLSRCLPHLDEQYRKQLKDKVVFHTILRILEMPFFWFNPRCADIDVTCLGEEHLTADVKAGKGAIILAPHIGCWELLTAYLPKKISLVSLYKPASNAYQEALLRMARERHGVEMYPTTISGVKALFSALKKGQFVGILPDHDPGHNGGVLAPFFGIPANTTTLIAKLAIRSQALVYFVLPERLPKGNGFRLTLVQSTHDLTNPDMIAAATALNAGIEDLIMRCPEQYDWSHKRFRRTLWNHAPFYPKKMPADIGCLDFKTRLEKSTPFILDVRNADEYAVDNLGGYLIPLDELPTRMSELPQDHSTFIVVHCAHGIRSAKAQKFLEKQGYKYVRSLEGGLAAFRSLTP